MRRVLIVTGSMVAPPSSAELSQHLTGGDGSVVQGWVAPVVSTEAERGESLYCREEIPQLTRRRKVLVLGGDLDFLDAIGRVEVGDHRFHQFLGRRRSGSDPDDSLQIRRELLGAVDAKDAGAADFASEPLECKGVRGVGRADHHYRIASRGDLCERGLTIGRGKAQVAAARGPDVGESAPGCVEDVFPVAVTEGGLSKKSDRLLELGECLDVTNRFDSMHGIRCHRHRAHRFLVALVADVDDLVSLARTDLHLVMDLRHERAHRVNDVPSRCSGRCEHLGSRSVSAEHDRTARWDDCDVVDEHHPEVLESLHDLLVVHDLVVAVHGWLEGPDHPRQGLYRHLYPGTEATGRCEQHAVYLHAERVPTPRLVSADEEVHRRE